MIADCVRSRNLLPPIIFDPSLGQLDITVPNKALCSHFMCMSVLPSACLMWLRQETPDWLRERNPVRERSDTLTVEPAMLKSLATTADSCNLCIVPMTPLFCIERVLTGARFPFQKGLHECRDHLHYLGMVKSMFPVLTAGAC